MPLPTPYLYSPRDGGMKGYEGLPHISHWSRSPLANYLPAWSLGTMDQCLPQHYASQVMECTGAVGITPPHTRENSIIHRIVFVLDIY